MASEADGSDKGLPDRVMKRAQWRLLPMLFTAYLVAIVDRINISFAAESMNRDLGFTASVYGFAGGLFFVSYALLEVPSNMLMMRFGTRVWVTRIMISWGLISAAQMFVTTPFQYYVLRFLLGAAEAGFFPSILFYASLWFPAQWRGRVVSRFYIAQPASQAVLGLVSAPLLGLDGALGLAGWQWLLLLEAGPAIITGLVIWRWLPDRPEQVGWLSAAEKHWLTGQLAADAAAIAGPQHGSMLRALADRQILGLGIAWLLLAGSVNAYLYSMPLILAEQTGLGTAAVGQLVTIGGMVGVVVLLALGWHSDRRQERHWHVLLPWALVGVAFVVLGVTTSPVLAMAAALAIAALNLPSHPVFWALVSEQLHERHRAVGIAAVNTFGQFGSFLSTSALGVARDATGGYDAGMAAIAGCVALSILILHRQHLVRPRRTSSPP
ncbi:MFS transporter [Sandarakinorhabdus oryzae]|uniref:MFS transporter n=1 Tax=Sandarakinorhabdus oryzae TaxID=2675220 RepID=UPI0018CC41B2|nr:MFS transporter [Sandarakinorhabdus oryzae]